MGVVWAVVCGVTRGAGAACLGASLLLGAPRAARAEEPSAQASDEASAEAKRLYEEGVSAARAARWDDAARAFREAFRRKPHYQIAINLGQAELRSGSYRDAAEHLSYFLRATEGTAGPDQDIARSFLEEARSRVGAIRVEASQRGAEIWIDGRRAGVTPLEEEIFVEPGERRIEARLSGYLPASETRRIGAGEALKVDLSLAQATPAKAAPPPAPPAAGGRSIRNAIVIGGAATSGAAAVAGAVLAVVSSVKASARDRASAEQCAGQAGGCRRNDLESERATFANASFYSFIAAGAVGAGTLVYALLTPSRAAKSPLPVQAAVGPGGAAVGLRVRF